MITLKKVVNKIGKSCGSTMLYLGDLFHFLVNIAVTAGIVISVSHYIYINKHSILGMIDHIGELIRGV